ncbi:hypothetical protein VTK56DRAFT_9741 [Thermocarpiscus australiensis]
MSSSCGQVTALVAVTLSELLVIKSDDLVLQPVLINNSAAAEDGMLILLEQQLRERLSPKSPEYQNFLHLSLSEAVRRLDIDTTSRLLSQGVIVDLPPLMGLPGSRAPPEPLAVQWAYGAATAAQPDQRGGAHLILARLIARGVGVSAVSAQHGETARSIIVVQSNNSAIFAETLLSAGAEKTINSVDKSGFTALHHAARRRDDGDLIRLLVENEARPKTAAALIAAMGRAGVSVDPASPGTTTPLLDACQCNSVAIVRQLIDAEADVIFQS